MPVIAGLIDWDGAVVACPRRGEQKPPRETDAGRIPRAA